MYMLRSQCMICPIHMKTLARLFHAKICLGISFWYFYNGKRILAFASMLLFFAGACGGKEVCWWPVTGLGKQRNPSLHSDNNYVLCELILNSNSCVKLSGCVGVLVGGGFEKNITCVVNNYCVSCGTFCFVVLFECSSYWTEHLPLLTELLKTTTLSEKVGVEFFPSLPWFYGTTKQSQGTECSGSYNCRRATERGQLGHTT